MTATTMWVTLAGDDDAPPTPVELELDDELDEEGEALNDAIKTIERSQSEA